MRHGEPADEDNAGAKAAAFARAGMITADEAARMFGVAARTFEDWDRAGKLSFGQWLKLPWGGRQRAYPRDAVERMARELTDAPFPPPGTVDRHNAAEILGVAERTISTWEAEGRLTCGRVVSIPGKTGTYRIYPIEELHRLKEELAKPQPFPPPGFVDRHEGRRMFGVCLTTWMRWEREGRITCASWVPVPNKPGRCKIYPVAELKQLVEQFAQQRAAEQKKLEPYPDPDEPEVVRVPVFTEKSPGMEALIDACDLPRVTGKRWNWSPSKNNGGSVVLSMNGTPKPSLARILLGIDDRAQLVCHLNGDHLDCRRANLVVRTRAQVRRTAKKMRSKAGKVCSSRFKGVTRTASGRKWFAAIAINGKTRPLGRFRSEIDAALAYDAALREVMGPDALVNLPDPAEVERLRALEPVVEDGPFPPPGMVDRHEACRMFGVSIGAWTVWERRGRITCGQLYPLPDDKPGRCKLYPKDELERAREDIENLGKPYADPDRPGVWRVPIKGYLAYREALIDEADLPIVEGKNWNWSDRNDGTRLGTVILATTEGYVPLHRLIARATDPRTRVSFANRNPLDCRRENLLTRTLAEVARASRKMGSVNGRTYTSPYKGVSRDEQRGQWNVQIRKDGVGNQLGRFDSEIEAARAYDAAARVLFGAHARLNLPDQQSSERAMAEARRAMDSAVNRTRVQRRRQRDMERVLRRTASDATLGAAVESVGAAMISRRVARQLFDVSLPVWRRWQRFGWLPRRVSVEGKRMYPLPAIERLLQRCGLNVLPYPDPRRPGVYRVPLAGETAKGREALIDADALPLVQTRRWRFAPVAQGRGGEVQTMNPAENIRLHYVVMGLTPNDREYHLGHRNDDPLDCRHANLVVRTFTDTAANKRKQATFCGQPCTSRFKGVCRPKKAKRWVATIKKDRVTRRLGSFHDEIAAAQAYDEAARELFGEHARLNFPDGIDAFLERETTADTADAADTAAPPRQAAA
jgi:hypothetical protein